jgi:hypothetical protein
MMGMHARFSALVGGLLVLAAAPSALPQQTTERYIPIGTSPGVSGRDSYIGQIVGTRAEGTITIQEAGGERHTLTVPDDAPVWLDRSGQGLPSLIGSFADCQAGRRAEVMHKRDEPGTVAWIKVQVDDNN